MIQVRASDVLHATVSGNGMIAYRGNPEQVSKNVTGSGATIEQ